MMDWPRSLTAVVTLCLLAVTAGADAASVPVARDLVADAALAREQRIPILLVFTREDCGYCELLKRTVILPMIISGEYRDRVVIREVIVDDPADLRDFATPKDANGQRFPFLPTGNCRALANTTMVMTRTNPMRRVNIVIDLWFRKNGVKRSFALFSTVQ